MRLNKVKYYFFTGLFLLVVTVNINAQTSHKTTIITEANFKPVLPKVRKILERPRLLGTKKMKVNFNYDEIEDKHLPVKYELDTIQPANISKQPLDRIYKFYTKAGVGNYITPLFKLYYNQGRKRKNSFGLGVEHFSSSGPKDFINAAFSENKVFLHNKYDFTKNISLKSRAYYKREVRHSYGKFDEPISTQPVIDPIEYNVIGASATILKQDKDSGAINYTSKLKYNWLKTIVGNQENELGLSGDVNSFHGKHFFNVAYDLNYVNLFNNSNQYNFLFNVTPSITTNYENFYLKIGGSIAYTLLENTLSKAKSKPYIFPLVDISYDVIDKIIIPYASLKGGVKTNSLLSTHKRNIFINYSDHMLTNTLNDYTINLGIKGFVSSSIYFDLGYRFMEDSEYLLFVNQTNQINKSYSNFYSTVSDNIKTNAAYFELSYQDKEKIKVSASAVYSGYTPSRELKAWHLPELEIALRGKYNLADKIIAKLEAGFIGARYYRYNPIGDDVQAKKIKNNFDLNIGLEYRYTRKLSVFLDLTNILNNKYKRFHNYPTQGFGIIGGLTYSFL